MALKLHAGRYTQRKSAEEYAKAVSIPGKVKATVIEVTCYDVYVEPEETNDRGTGPS